MPIPLPSVGRPSRYVWVQALSVLVPGVLVLAEIWIIAVASRSKSLLHQLDETTKGLSVPTMLLVGLIAAATAYAVGMASRELAFSLLLPRRQRFAKTLKRVRLVAPSPGEAWRSLDREYPSMPAESEGILEKHPHLRRTEDRIAIVAYAKHRLGERPRLAFDDIGIEINMIVSLVLPIVFAPFVFVRSVGWLSSSVAGPWRILAAAGAVVAAVVCGGLCAKRALVLARYELEDAVRNLAFAAWLDEDADPAAIGPTPGTS